MIYVTSQIKSTIGSKQLRRSGFFVVEHVGTLFLKIVTIPMEAQENQNDQ